MEITQQLRVSTVAWICRNHTNNMLRNKTMESTGDTRFPSQSQDRGEIDKQVNGSRLAVIRISIREEATEN